MTKEDTARKNVQTVINVLVNICDQKLESRLFRLEYKYRYGKPVINAGERVLVREHIPIFLQRVIGVKDVRISADRRNVLDIMVLVDPIFKRGVYNDSFWLDEIKSDCTLVLKRVLPENTNFILTVI